MHCAIAVTDTNQSRTGAGCAENACPPPHNKHHSTSDQTASTAALDLCQRQWRVAFTNPLIGVGLCDLDRRLLDGNPVLEHLVGRTIDELCASSAPSATHPGDLEANLAAFRTVATGRQDQGSYTKRYVHRDGRIIWCHVWLGLVRDHDDKPHQIVIMAVDITAQVRAELALRAQQLGLSDMELAILPLLACPDLKSYRQIGARLCRSGETVRKHAQHLAEKLGLRTAARADIVRAAREHGLFNLASPVLLGEGG